ncbi:T9SS type A sorting domain-containing protein, partial [candidate division KSB1 bacterium]|nr:T9SS type A sorting domain-containing protein [candidate division KSB1 bacterium]
ADGHPPGAGQAEWQTIASYQTHPDLAGQGNTSSQTEYEYVDVTAQSGTTYQYRLSDVDTDGSITVLDIIEITMEIQKPEETQLEPPFPNPFNPQTKIAYKLAEQSSVTLNVYDINGRLVSTLLRNVQQSAGSYSIHWLGKDDMGRQAATGTYILRLIAGDIIKSQKVLLMR